MGQDLSGKGIEVAQLNQERMSPWIQFLPGIRGLLSVPVGLGQFPVLGRSPH